MKYCTQCGNRMEDEMHFCSNCGVGCSDAAPKSWDHTIPAVSSLEPGAVPTQVTTLTEHQMEAGSGIYQANQTIRSSGTHELAPRSNGLAIAGFVVSLCLILFVWVPIFGLILSLAALGLSGSGLWLANKKQGAIGMAASGLVLSIIFTIVSLVYMVRYWLPFFYLG